MNVPRHARDMMGRNHALIAGTTAAALAGAYGIHRPEELAMLAVVAAGGGLLPDLDHPQASPGRAFLFLGQGAAAATGALAGGHRKVTHSIIATAVIVLVAWGAWHDTRVAAVLVGVVATMAIWTVLPSGVGSRFFRHLLAWGGGAAAGYFWMTHPLPLLVFMAALAGGFFIHLLCDTLTVGGVRWLWPLPTRTSIPVCGCTGSGREHLLSVVVSVGAILLVATGH